MRKYEKYGGRNISSDHTCDWPDCTAKGDFRAPKINSLSSNTPLDEKDPDPFWFCLDHVREYNASFDFFKNKTTEEIEHWQLGNSTWHRPTWGFGKGGPDFENMNIIDRTGLTDEGGRINNANLTEKGPLNRPLTTKDRKALKTLGLDPQALVKDVKKAYKSLLKTLHPDIAGNDKNSANKLRDVIEAYNHLKKDFSKDE